jgi:hypothetical protein
MGHPGTPFSIGPFSGETGFEQFVFFVSEFESGHGSSSSGELPSVDVGLVNNVQYDLSDTA